MVLHFWGSYSFSALTNDLKEVVTIKSVAEFVFDYRQLRGRTLAQGKRDYEVARMLGITPATLSLHYTNGLSFTMKQVYMMCDYLSIPYEEIAFYFRLIKNPKFKEKRRAV